METSSGLREELAMQFDETGPNTHTRRSWVSATVALGALVVVFGSPAVKLVADSLVPWSLLVFAIAGLAMIVANKRSGQD